MYSPLTLPLLLHAHLGPGSGLHCCLHLAPGLIPGYVSACLEHKDPGFRVLGSCRKKSKGKKGRGHPTTPQTLVKIPERRSCSHCPRSVPPKLSPQTSDSDVQENMTKCWGEAPCQVDAESLAVSTLGKQVSIPRLPELEGSIAEVLQLPFVFFSP